MTRGAERETPRHGALCESGLRRGSPSIALWHSGARWVVDSCSTMLAAPVAICLQPRARAPCCA
eukprot:12701496-Alexandrium_andersonii.AAC.1